MVAHFHHGCRFPWPATSPSVRSRKLGLLGFNVNHEELVRFLTAYPDCSRSLLSSWVKWEAANPRMMPLWERFAREAFESKRGRYSGWMIANRIRWHVNVETTGDFYKLRNDFIAVFMRVLVLRHPEYETVFELRPMKLDRRVGGSHV